MRLGLALLAIVPSISAPARSDYLPLETGRTWTYASDGILRWLEKEVLGPVEFYGQQDIRVRWEFEGLGPAYLYLQETAEGEVSFHATELEPDLNVYDPPRVVLDMPLTVGSDERGIPIAPDFASGFPSARHLLVRMGCGLGAHRERRSLRAGVLLGAGSSGHELVGVHQSALRRRPVTDQHDPIGGRS